MLGVDYDAPFAAPFAIGSIVKDKYRIEKDLGVGGMSVVWRVHDVPTNDLLAIKETSLLAGMPDQRKARRAAMENEARILQKLNHPSIPRFVESFEWADSYCIVMGYVTGCTLYDELCRRGTIDQKTVVR